MTMADPRRCPACERVFTPSLKRRSQKFCSHSCAAKVNRFGELGAMVGPPAARRRAEKTRGTGKSGGYVKLGGRHMHRVVAEQNLGRALLPGEIAHHDDEDKRNNAPSNIAVLPSQSDHARLHMTGSKRYPRQTCKRGHELSGDNVFITSIGRRRCRTCERTYQREWRRDKRREDRENPSA